MVVQQEITDRMLPARRTDTTHTGGFKGSSEDGHQNAMSAISPPLGAESSTGQLDVHSEMAERAVSLLAKERAGKRTHVSGTDNDRPMDHSDTSTHPGTPPPKRSRHQPFPDEDDVPAAAEGNESVFVGEYINLSDFRASGVFSAAALFRTPSAKSKKYTRPPMSRLFASLSLTPESFLHLQAAAKAYMLDPTHPERQTCVGNKAKGDNDLTKLRLFHCVRAFLEDDGIGETYFGEGSEGATNRGWSWPKDLNKVVGSVTPLLRRMVTNERQRQYALEARKTPLRKTLCKAADNRAVEPDTQPFRDPARGASGLRLDAPSPTQPLAWRSPGLTPTYSLHIVLGRSGRECGQVAHSSPLEQSASGVQLGSVQASLDCPFDACPDLATLMRLIEDVSPASASPESSPALAVYVLLPRGLTSIETDEHWVSAMDEVRSAIWLEGRLTVVVVAGCGESVVTNHE